MATRSPMSTTWGSGPLDRDHVGDRVRFGPLPPPIAGGGRHLRLRPQASDAFVITEQSPRRCRWDVGGPRDGPHDPRRWARDAPHRDVSDRSSRHRTAERRDRRHRGRSSRSSGTSVGSERASARWRTRWTGSSSMGLPFDLGVRARDPNTGGPARRRHRRRRGERVRVGRDGARKSARDESYGDTVTVRSGDHRLRVRPRRADDRVFEIAAGMPKATRFAEGCA